MDITLDTQGFEALDWLINTAPPFIALLVIFLFVLYIFYRRMIRNEERYQKKEDDLDTKNENQQIKLNDQVNAIIARQDYQITLKEKELADTKLANAQTILILQTKHDQEKVQLELRLKDIERDTRSIKSELANCTAERAADRKIVSALDRALAVAQKELIDLRSSMYKKIAKIE